MKLRYRLSALVVIPAVVAGLISYKVVAKPTEFFSPLSSSNVITQNARYTQKIVYGFLPYWSVKADLIVPENTLTHIAYFGFAIDESGNIENDIGAKRITSEHYEKIKTLIAKESLHSEAVFTIFDEDILESVLTNTTVRQKTIASIQNTVITHGFSGVNIDFEPTGQISPRMRAAFTEFIQTLNQELYLLNPKLTLSVDVYASAVDQNKLWDIAILKDNVDHLIIMAYDYHRPGSPTTGPISPLYGAGLNRWSQDIMSNLKSINELVPSHQIILGVPLYGYQWQATQKDIISHSYPKTGRTQTYQKIMDLIPTIIPTYHWDRDSMTPWVSFMENDEYYQLHYENEASLGLKLDLVNQSDLGGVAIWALGYEGSYQNIWKPFQTKLNRIEVAH